MADQVERTDMADKMDKEECVTEVVREIKTRTVNIPHRQTALPRETIFIPLHASCAQLYRIAIIPTFEQMHSHEWLPQVCSIYEGQAAYINTSSDKPISHPKHSHFRTIPVKESPWAEFPKTSRAPMVHQSPVSVEKLLCDIKINEKMLDKGQLESLRETHTRNRDAFHCDLKGGYNQSMGKYIASFSFKDNSKPPPLKVWVPQYNRACAELLQAKCDQLEAQGVLADPAELGIDIKHVSPTLIQQKGRAKHKSLAECTLDEIRFISCQNVLNDSIKPVQSSSTSPSYLTI